MLKVWDGKSLAALLDISSSKISQATGPMAIKLGKMADANLPATLRFIAEAIERVVIKPE